MITSFWFKLMAAAGVSGLLFFLVAHVLMPPLHRHATETENRLAQKIRNQGHKVLSELQYLSLTGKKQCYENATEGLAQLELDLEELERLATQNARDESVLNELRTLRQHAESVRTLTDGFFAVSAEINQWKNEAADIHRRFMAIQNLYAGSLADKALAEIKEKAAEVRIEGSMRRIASNADFSHSISECMAGTLKAQDEFTLRPVAEEISRLLKQIEAQQAATQDENDLKRLLLLKELALHFQESTARLRQAMVAYDLLEKQRVGRHESCSLALNIFADEYAGTARIQPVLETRKTVLWTSMGMVGLALGALLALGVYRFRAQQLAAEPKPKTALGMWRILPLSDAERN